MFTNLHNSVDDWYDEMYEYLQLSKSGEQSI